MRRRMHAAAEGRVKAIPGEEVLATARAAGEKRSLSCATSREELRAERGPE
jgi:hypothetical protein